MTAPNNISYKDTAARVVIKEGNYYRYIFKEYQKEYDCLMQSGLYKNLQNKGYLIPHTEIAYNGNDLKVYKLLFPEQINFQSYPFCWSYKQWRKAIIAYLEINKIAISYGMILKDATPFNFYFKEGRAILLDTSSFSFLKEGAPWLAYQQFCSEFFSPLALMHYNGQIWSGLLKANIKGLPLNFVSKQLPFHSWFNLSCLLHIHMHSKYANKDGNTNDEILKKSKQKYQGFSKEKLLSILDMFLDTIKKWDTALKIDKHWQKYYDHDIESLVYLSQKEAILQNWLNLLNLKTVIDLGANTGKFSFLAAKKVDLVISIESDYNCVDTIEDNIDEGSIKNVIALQMNLTETTPSMGFLEKEFSTIFERFSNKQLSPSLVMGLAIVHHLYITYFLSFNQIAELVSKFNSRYLILEYIPIEDSKVQLLKKNNARDFSHYTQENFTKAMIEYFKILEIKTIKGSNRELFLLEKYEKY